MQEDYASSGEVAGTIMKYFGIVVVISGAIIGSGMYGCPMYNVYASRMAGEAELAQANYSKQVSVQTARAAKDSADLYAQKRIIDARGIAEANRIVASQLGGPDNYLRFEYIQMLKEQQNKQIIYLPTEASMPILEAGKH